MLELNKIEVSSVSGAGVGNDLAAVAIVVGLVCAPEVTVPMFISAELGLGGLALSNFGY